MLSERNIFIPLSVIVSEIVHDNTHQLTMCDEQQATCSNSTFKRSIPQRCHQYERQQHGVLYNKAIISTAIHLIILTQVISNLPYAHSQVCGQPVAHRSVQFIGGTILSVNSSLSNSECVASCCAHNGTRVTITINTISISLQTAL
jgi:hypothetical protein